VTATRNTKVRAGRYPGFHDPGGLLSQNCCAVEVCRRSAARNPTSTSTRTSVRTSHAPAPPS
jgi:hypothetical protein